MPKAQTSTFRKEYMYSVIDRLVIDKFTGKLEINISQGTINVIKKEETINLSILTTE